MFADQALALRIERAEARLMRDGALGVARSTRDGRAFARDLGGGVATFVRRGSPFNKIIGAGLDGVLEVADLAPIESLYREHDEPVRIELSTLAPPDAGRSLTERGYRLLGFENVLGRPLSGRLPEPPADVRVERITAEGLDEWRGVTLEGFSAPDGTGAPVDAFTRDAIGAALTDSMHTPGQDRYLASRGGVTAGAASLRLDGTIALFTGATTLAPQRRRGVQAALFAARLDEARARGAEIAVITTAVATQSQANAMKKGFALLYARAVLVLGA